MKPTTWTCIIAVFIITSCNSYSHGDTDASLPKFTTVTAATPDKDSISQSVEAIQVNPASAGVVINPPHGEPGHDCNVAVGEPLNKGIQAQLPASITGATAPSVRLNPPHGQPGHVCEIEVGQPLP